MNCRPAARCGSRMAYLGLVLLVIGVTSGCASQSANLTNPQADPWEHFNRKIYKFNDRVDRAILKPIAKTYDVIMPDAPQRGVRNFFHNLAYPVNFINLILQGKFEDAITATGRFVMNSTVGVLGFFDVATHEGVPDPREDFGQTMAKWGWKKSRYLVVPFFGPFTVRDAGGRFADSFANPVTYVARHQGEYRPLILDIISLRASLLPLDKDLKNAMDPYALMRDAYLQKRQYDIYDGQPPAPDYDALMEDN